MQMRAVETVCQFVGFGSALPSLDVANHQFEGILDTSDAWISHRTGIRSRKYCAPHESSATLGIEACKKAMADAQIRAEEIDMIICATVSPQSTTPPNATRIQDALGCRTIPAFDISAACSGFLFALSTASSFIESGNCKTVMVVAAEALSRRLDFNDRNSCILFGDAAGAVVVRKEELLAKTAIGNTTDKGTYPRLLSCEVRSEPDSEELIRVPSNKRQSANSLASSLNLTGTKDFDHIGISGREVFRFAIETMCQCIWSTCRRHGIAPGNLDLIVPHQVNTRVFNAVEERLSIDRSKIYRNMSQYGNTSAASIPLALSEVSSLGLASPGDLVCLVAFGGGMTFGSALMQW